jgi:hypothetical protein
MATSEPKRTLGQAVVRSTDRDGTVMVRLTDRSGTVMGTVTVLLPQRCPVVSLRWGAADSSAGRWDRRSSTPGSSASVSSG